MSTYFSSITSMGQNTLANPLIMSSAPLQNTSDPTEFVELGYTSMKSLLKSSIMLIKLEPKPICF